MKISQKHSMLTERVRVYQFFSSLLYALINPKTKRMYSQNELVNIVQDCGLRKLTRKKKSTGKNIRTMYPKTSLGFSLNILFKRSSICFGTSFLLKKATASRFSSRLYAPFLTAMLNHQGNLNSLPQSRFHAKQMLVPDSSFAERIFNR